jgi:predicted O-methyltransferase YrrM
MSFPRLASALLNGQPYFGSALRALQGVPERHRYFLPVVRRALEYRAGPLSVLEIGSWAGASTVTWAIALRQTGGGHVTCVDLWAPYFNLQTEHGTHYREMTEAAQSGAIFRLFLHNLKACAVENTVTHHIGDSREVLSGLPPRSFDIIYIDGSHDYAMVKSDIEQAKQLLRTDGIVCGDDLELQRREVDDTEHTAHLAAGTDYAYSSMSSRHYHPGVTEAVAEELGDVAVYDGFWAAEFRDGGAMPAQLDTRDTVLPEHIAQAMADTPKLVSECGQFNIVQSSGQYVAVAKSLGPVDLLLERLGERDLGDLLLVSDDLADLQRRVTQLPCQQRAELLHEGPIYNIVQIGSRFVAVARALGPIDLMQERIGERELGNLIVIAEDRQELEERIATISAQV